MQAFNRLTWPLLAAAILVSPMPALARYTHGAVHHKAHPKAHAVKHSASRHLDESDPVFAYVRRQAGLTLARRYAPLIHEKAAKYHLPPMVVAGIINYESHFDTHCRTGRARGLMQVNHGHEKPGQNLYDPATNLDVGCRVLREYYVWAKRHMPPDATEWQIWNKALTTYNFGPIQVVSRGLMHSRYSRTIIRAWRSNLLPDDR